MLRCEYQWSDLLGELTVVTHDRIVATEERRSPVTFQLLTDVVVFLMFDDQLRNLLVAEVDCRQQRLIDASLVDVIQQKSDGLSRTNIDICGIVTARDTQ